MMKEKTMVPMGSISVHANTRLAQRFGTMTREQVAHIKKCAFDPDHYVNIAKQTDGKIVRDISVFGQEIRLIIEPNTRTIVTVIPTEWDPMNGKVDQNRPATWTELDRLCQRVANLESFVHNKKKKSWWRRLFNFKIVRVDD